LSIRITTGYAWCLASLLLGCSDDEPALALPIFPAEWAQTFEEVRDCRRSGDHDLNHVRILVDPAARGPYQNRNAAFPVGAVILKAEYADEDCTDLAGFTAMRREQPGYDPGGGDWHWQRTDAARAVIDDGIVGRCRSCHVLCGVPPDGHDGTCAIP
jgi:hypothetical protein